MGGQNGNASAAIRRKADARWGVVARRHLIAAGVSERVIERRLESGMLVVEYPGVYRVGPPRTEARYMAAVLACGDRAGLSGLPAAWWWALIKGDPPAPEVSAPTKRRILGLATRRRLHPGEITTHRGIPVTSVALTLCDLAPLLALDDLALACHEAGIKHRATPRQVEEALARRPNTPGARKLRTVIHGEQPVSLSKLEKRFLDVLRAHSLPLPRTNKPAGTYRVDCRWPEHRLTVELDSYAFHNSRYSWEQDRRRERQAYARGDRFRRYTYGDVFEEPRAMLRELRTLLIPV
jgi:very-short-patch-repair endonuclease